jgi:hypothetical protein
MHVLALLTERPKTKRPPGGCHMPPTRLEVGSLEQAMSEFLRLSELPLDGDEELAIAPGWALARVYIPRPRVSSSISPPMMEAFLAIQKEIYQLAAFGKTGIAHTKKLNDIDRHQLELVVVVKGGSSNLLADLAKPFERCARLMLGKLSGRQVTLIFLACAILFAGNWSFQAWLEAQKQLRLEQIKTEDRLAVLRSMQFATEQQRKMFERVIDILERQGAVGGRASGAVDRAFGALLKAAEAEAVSEINGATITDAQASMLREAGRVRPITRFAVERMRVVVANTGAPTDQIVFRRPGTGEEFRVRLSETLFSAADRTRLFDALETKVELDVELAFREVDGVVRHVTFVRVAE